MSGQDSKKVIEINLPIIRERTDLVLRGAGRFAASTLKLPKAFFPVAQLLLKDAEIHRTELAEALDTVFDALYRHPVTSQSRAFTSYLRKARILPNEETTENLIRFLVNQVVVRSPVEIPEPIINEFWTFFHELMSAPELKGLVELNLDIVRSVLRTYEPLIVDLINRVKHIRRFNQVALGEMMQKVHVLRGDLLILRRQIRAIRYIKPFLQTDPKDFGAQAQIVAQMVREFGPLFIKMAQVAAANADFLPEEIAQELRVFQEDVSPMTPEEVTIAFLECFGKTPAEMYYQLDLNKPLRSGSIGSVYVAKKAVMRGGVEVLVPVVVKVARHNLEREFQMGTLALELMLISSQYWAPHSKLLPFLEAMSSQVKEFSRGFEQELNFEDEAAIQRRFAERAQQSRMWHVPQMYVSSGRVLEMEYLEHAVAINRAIGMRQGKQRERFQRQVAEKFLYTMLQHILVYNEFHGDLHPGNIMIADDGELFLIDWGNAVNMQGKWHLLGNYIAGALLGDTERLADALIEMSTRPEENQRRREEIRQALDETLAKRNVVPLDRHLIRTLRREGTAGLHRRLQCVMHLLSNSYQLGIVVQSDYLHLSRSLVAMAGTYANLYADIPKTTMLRDMVRDVALFPLNLARDRMAVQVDRLQQRLPFLG